MILRIKFYFRRRKILFIWVCW